MSGQMAENNGRIDSERRILAEHLRGVPRFFSKEKVRMFTADDLAREMTRIFNEPDEHTKSLKSRKTGHKCLVCLLRKEELYFRIEPPEGHPSIRICKYCAWRLREQVNELHRKARGKPTKKRPPERLEPPFSYDSGALDAFLRLRASKNHDSVQRIRVPRSLSENSGFYSPSFAGISEGWYMTTRSEPYASERDQALGWWDDAFDATIEWFLEAYGMFLLAAMPAIEREVKMRAPTGAQVPRYLEYFVLNRVVQDDRLWNAFARDLLRRGDQVHDCHACGRRQLWREIKPDCIAWSHGEILPLCVNHWKALIRTLAPSVPAYMSADLYSEDIESVLGFHSCPVCSVEHSWRDRTYDYTDGFYGIPRRYREICFDCLNQAINKRPRRGCTKSNDLEALYELSVTINSIPDEDMWKVIMEQCRTVDQATTVVSIMARMRPFSHVKKQHGSWFAALSRSGALPEGTRKEVFGTRILAKDGHECLSMGERIIDDFMFENGIRHRKEITYPGSNFVCDWVVEHQEKPIYVEYYGLAGQKAYDKKIIEKRRLAISAGIRLVEVYPEDLARLDEILQF